MKIQVKAPWRRAKQQQRSAKPGKSAEKTAGLGNDESSGTLLSKIPVVGAIDRRRRERIAEKERKAAEERARKKAEDKKVLIACSVCFALIFAFIGIMSLGESQNEVTQSQGVVGSKPDQSSLETELPETETNIEETVPPQSEKTEQQEEEIQEPQPAVVEEDSSTETAVEKDEEIPFSPINDMTAHLQTDYAHFDTETAILGNGEGLSVEVAATPAGLVKDDFLFVSADEGLDYTLEEIRSDQSRNETIARLRISSLSEGYHSFLIISSYDYATMGDDCPVIPIDIHGLSSRDGRVVYVTPTGEKYHYSADCAGGGAIATTLYDVEALEYEPCGKCVG